MRTRRRRPKKPTVCVERSNVPYELLSSCVKSIAVTAEEEFAQYKVPKALKQYFVMVPAKRRLVVLAAFLRWRALTQEACKMIVFVSTTDCVDFVYAIYSAMQFPTAPPTLTKKDEAIGPECSPCNSARCLSILMCLWLQR